MESISFTCFRQIAVRTISRSLNFSLIAVPSGIRSSAASFIFSTTLPQFESASLGQGDHSQKPVQLFEFGELGSQAIVLMDRTTPEKALKRKAE